MITKILTATFIVLWSSLTGVYVAQDNWLYAGTSIAAVAWNASYLRDTIIRDRKERGNGGGPARESSS